MKAGGCCQHPRPFCIWRVEMQGRLWRSVTVAPARVAIKRTCGDIPFPRIAQGQHAVMTAFGDEAEAIRQ